MTRNRNVWPKAVLLDFYGTVVHEDDTAAAPVVQRIAQGSPAAPSPESVRSFWIATFNKLCAESHGKDFRPQRQIERLAVGRVAQHFDAPIDIDWAYGRVIEHLQHPPIFPESKSVLAACDAPICLVSNIDNEDLAAALTMHGLSFDRVVTSEDCRSYKPRPEMFDWALSLLNLPAEDVLHVGDSLDNDVRGAKGIGLATLWINRLGKDVPDDDCEPVFVSHDLGGLLHILREHDDTSGRTETRT